MVSRPGVWPGMFRFVKTSMRQREPRRTTSSAAFAPEAARATVLAQAQTAAQEARIAAQEHSLVRTVARARPGPELTSRAREYRASRALEPAPQAAFAQGS